MIDRRITKFKLRRGLDDQRKTVVLEEGELVYTTDTNRIYVGTGFTSGGIIVANSITYTVSDFPAKNTPNDLVYREDHKRLYIYKDNIGGSPVARYVGPEADGSSIAFNSSNMLTIASGGVNNTHLNYTAVASAGGLGLSADGLYIKYNPTDLIIEDGMLRIAANLYDPADIDPNGGLTARTTGVAVNTDNNTIVIGSNNTIKVSSISAENISVSAVHASNLHPDVAVTDGGIVRTSSGLSASIDNTTIKITAGKMGVDSSALGLGSLAVPFGTIIHTACSVAPTGYLACSGQRVRGSDYPALSAAIYVGNINNTNTSIQYGKIYADATSVSPDSNGSYISLPDLRGIFMRGWNFTADTSPTYPRDASRVFGSFQSDDFKSHTHFIPVAQGIAGYGSNGAFEGGTFNPGGATSGATGGTETRPVNLAFLACIKAY